MVGRILIVPFVNQVGKTDFPEERPTLSKQRSPPSRFRTGPPPSRNHRNRKRNGKETNHNRSLPSKCVYLFLNRGPPPPGGRGVTREPFMPPSDRLPATLPAVGPAANPSPWRPPYGGPGRRAPNPSSSSWGRKWTFCTSNGLSSITFF